MQRIHLQRNYVTTRLSRCQYGSDVGRLDRIYIYAELMRNNVHSRLWPHNHLIGFVRLYFICGGGNQTIVRFGRSWKIIEICKTHFKGLHFSSLTTIDREKKKSRGRKRKLMTEAVSVARRIHFGRQKKNTINCRGGGDAFPIEMEYANCRHRETATESAIVSASPMRCDVCLCVWRALHFAADEIRVMHDATMGALIWCRRAFELIPDLLNHD